MKILDEYIIGSVMITGTNRGIGLELVKSFTEKNRLTNSNVKVISCSRQMSPELQKLIEDENVFHVELEITNCESVRKAFGKVSQILGDGGLNLLINNAAKMVRSDGSLACSEQELSETLNINVTGAHSVSKEFFPLLKKAALNSAIPHCCARAAVFNISSQLGSIANTNNSFATAYRVSKAALNMLTKCTAMDFIKDDIICLAVHPGWVRTDLGGPNAPMSAAESVQDIVHLIENCTKDHNGMFVRKGFVVDPY